MEDDQVVEEPQHQPVAADGGEQDQVGLGRLAGGGREPAQTATRPGTRPGGPTLVAGQGGGEDEERPAREVRTERVRIHRVRWNTAPMKKASSTGSVRAVDWM